MKKKYSGAKKISANIQGAASALGAIGGAAGTGSAKARKGARRAIQIRWARHNARRLAAHKGWETRRANKAKLDALEENLEREIRQP